MAVIFDLTEDPQQVVQASAWVGDWHSYVVRLVDELGSPVDITTGTLGVTFTNIATGSAYTFPSGSVTLTKQYSAQGILSILNPAALHCGNDSDYGFLHGEYHGATVRAFRD